MPHWHAVCLLSWKQLLFFTKQTIKLDEMNILEKQGIDSIPVAIKRKVKRDKMIIDLDFSVVAKEESAFKGEVNVGLCINCDSNIHCTWQRNNKMFCEHYQ
ncbi:hypothetical protein [Flavobacterium gillisiae]|nr:hypothetical protein [Flavobacterium gillisiae]